MRQLLEIALGIVRLGHLPQPRQAFPATVELKRVLIRPGIVDVHKGVVQICRFARLFDLVDELSEKIVKVCVVGGGFVG